jgi:hypothetical protein
MANHEPVRHRAVGEFVGETMSTARATLYADSSIAVTIYNPLK